MRRRSPWGGERRGGAAARRELPLLEKSKGLRNPETQLALERLVELYRAWRKPAERARYEALLAQARGG